MVEKERKDIQHSWCIYYIYVLSSQHVENKRVIYCFCFSLFFFNFLEKTGGIHYFKNNCYLVRKEPRIREKKEENGIYFKEVFLTE